MKQLKIFMFNFNNHFPSIFVYLTNLFVVNLHHFYMKYVRLNNLASTAYKNNSTPLLRLSSKSFMKIINSKTYIGSGADLGAAGVAAPASLRRRWGSRSPPPPSSGGQPPPPRRGREKGTEKREKEKKGREKKGVQR